MADASPSCATAGTPAAAAIADTSLEEIIRLMVGRPVTDLFPRDRPPAGRDRLGRGRLEGASAWREPVSLELRRGEILGLAGLIGAGRTETLRTIFGLDAAEVGDGRASAGTAAPAGEPWRMHRPRARTPERGPAGRRAWPSADRSRTTSPSAASALPAARISQPREAGGRRPPRWIDELNIKAREPRPGRVAGLSGGNQQKVALARLLHQDADVLLLDEPTRGIDV